MFAVDVSPSATSRILIFSSDEDARSAIESVDAHELTECLRGWLQASAAPDIEVTGASVSQLAISSFGQRASAYRISLDMFDGVSTQIAYIDLVLVLKERALAMLFFLNSPQPFPDADRIAVTSRVVERMRLPPPTPPPTPTPTITPTPTPTSIFTSKDEPPIKILGPVNLEEYVGLRRSDLFVVDIQSREIFLVGIDDAIRREGGEERFQALQWFDDDSLILETSLQRYRAQLNGETTIAGLTTLRTPTPAIRDAVSSADGTWVARRGEPATGDWLVGPPGGEPGFRLNNLWPPVWSPAGNLLAFTGNVCTVFDLFVFDPAAIELRNLSPSLPAAWDFAWKPDGSAIALDVLGFGDPDNPRRGLSLIDVKTGASETLAEIHTFGELAPVEWSPGGDRLLFRYIPGRGACESAFLPGVPTPAPTRLEILEP